MRRARLDAAPGQTMPPDALDPLGVHLPTFGPEQGRDPPLAISAILAGQADDRRRQCRFLIPTTGSLALG